MLGEYNLKVHKNFLLLRLRTPMAMNEARACVRDLLTAVAKIAQGQGVLFVDARLGEPWTPDVYHLFLGLLTRDHPGLQRMAWLIDRGTAGISIMSGARATVESGRQVRCLTQEKNEAVDWLAPVLTEAQVKVLREHLGTYV